MDPAPAAVLASCGLAAAAAIAVLLTRLARARRRAQAEAEARAAAGRAEAERLAALAGGLLRPLDGIDALAGLLADAALDAGQRERVRLAVGAAQRLRTLAESLLPEDAAAGPAARVRCRLRETVEEAVDLLEPLAAAAGVGLDAIVSRSLPAAALGDPDRLRRLLCALIGDAAAAPGAAAVVLRVAAGADPGGGRLRLAIAVEGGGAGEGPGARAARRLARTLGGEVRRDGPTLVASAVVEPDPAPPAPEPLRRPGRDARVVIGVDRPAARDGLCELAASLGLEPIAARDAADAARIGAASPPPAAAIIEAGWLRAAGPALVAAGVPVATVASADAGGTQAHLARRAPVLPRPFRRDGLLRVLAHLWGDRTPTGRIARPDTGALRRPPA